MKESLLVKKKRPESLFYGDLWYNEAINIEIGRKTCFVLRKKKKIEIPFRSPKNIGIIMDGNGRWAKKADATARLRS